MEGIDVARARNIKPGFFKNPELVELPFEYRLLFIGLWTLADREGRLEDRPKQIRMELFPADDVDCGAGLQALHDSELIVRYAVEGKAYVWIPAFAEHQNPHPREAASAIPPYQGPFKGQTHDLFDNAKDAPRPCLGDAKEVASRADVLNPSSLNPESSPSGRGRASRLPKDWQATPEQLDWAIQEQPTWTREHACKVSESFRDYWAAKAGRDATKTDWEATWRNWVRREGEMRRGGKVVDLAERNRAAADEFVRSQGGAE